MLSTGEMNSAISVNVASHLAALAASDPDRRAVVLARDERASLSFRQLHERSDAIAHGLAGIGIMRGMRTVLMTPPSLDFFSLTFALFKIGAVPVLIDPGMGIKNLGVCLGEAEPTAFIGIPKAHIARKLLGWARRSIRITVTTGRFWAGHSLQKLHDVGVTPGPFPLVANEADETAAILFTSGSTGVAKGVVYTHGIFTAQVDLLRSIYGIESGEIDLSTFPLFALFGPALGMTAIVPDMDPTRPAEVDPQKMIAAIERFKVTNLFGSPALINRVGRYGAEHGSKLPTLRRVISAGAPVPAKVIERFTRMLAEDVQVHTPYGATEALPVATIGSDELLAKTRMFTDRGCGVCVGRPVVPMQVRILPISDSILSECPGLAPRQLGEIAVAGPVVTRSYFQRAGATELAKIVDPQTGTLWHRMGDLGYLDAHGRLWFCGRKSHRVVTAHGTLFTIPCEAIFNTHPLVFRTALVGVEKRPVLCAELEPGAEWHTVEPAMRQLAQKFPHTQAITTFLHHPRFPVDIRHNAKIFREKLAVWATRQLRGRPWPSELPAIVLPPTCDDMGDES